MGYSVVCNKVRKIKLNLKEFLGDILSALNSKKIVKLSFISAREYYEDWNYDPFGCTLI